MPQFYHTQVWITATHIAGRLQLYFCVLVGMTVRTYGLAGQGCCTPIPVGLLEIDVRRALVVFPAGLAAPVFLCIFHQGLPIFHVVCYTFAHEGHGLPFVKLSIATQL